MNTILVSVSKSNAIAAFLDRLVFDHHFLTQGAVLAVYTLVKLRANE